MSRFKKPTIFYPNLKDKRVMFEDQTIYTFIIAIWKVSQSTNSKLIIYYWIAGLEVLSSIVRRI
jgi:hypothetical protein